jgi:2-polyprenyl-3-methyl-5-hydroxy-6-metoxy-1,4-benzoquinol methylase
MLKISKSKFPTIQNVKFREQDITNLNNIGEKFDIIICTWVLSHLKSPSALANQTQNLLNRGGKIFIICFTKPKWYINFWFFPFARYLFKARYVSPEEIKKIENIKTKYAFAANITTTIEI